VHAGAHGGQAEAAAAGVGGRYPAGVESGAVVDDVEGDMIAEVAEGDLDTGGAGVADGVGEGGLGDAQQGDLVCGGQRQGVTGEVEACGDGVPGGSGGAQALQGARQGGVLQGGRGEGGDEAAGFGEVVHGGLACLVHVAGSGAFLSAGQGAFGGAQEQLDAGQPLGEGVVDLAGQAFAFGQYTGGVLGTGQVDAGGGEFHDQATALFALTEQCLVSPHHRDGDRGSQSWADRHGEAERALMGCEAGDRREGGRGHGGQTGAARQQVELEEEQREGDPDGVGGQRQQRQPAGTHGGQPH